MYVQDSRLQQLKVHVRLELTAILDPSSVICALLDITIILTEQQDVIFVLQEHSLILEVILDQLRVFKIQPVTLVLQEQPFKHNVHQVVIVILDLEHAHHVPLDNIKMQFIQVHVNNVQVQVEVFLELILAHHHVKRHVPMDIYVLRELFLGLKILVQKAITVDLVR
jgi:hypothetical protein